MGWYLRTDDGADAVEWETLDKALEHLKTIVDIQKARGYEMVKHAGRVSFFDGYQLVSTVWIEDEDGQQLPIP